MPDRQPQALPDKLATTLMAALLAIGFYFPTSLGEKISTRLYFVGAAILLAILTALLLRRRGFLSVTAAINVAAINVILLVCTYRDMGHSFNGISRRGFRGIDE